MKLSIREYFAGYKMKVAILTSISIFAILIYCQASEKKQSLVDTTSQKIPTEGIVTFTSG